MGTHLHMSRDLLLARKTVIAVSRTSLPEAIVVGTSAAYMRRSDVLRQLIARREALPAFFPLADMRRRREAIMLGNWCRRATDRCSVSQRWRGELAQGLWHRLEYVESALDVILEVGRPGGDTKVVLQQMACQNIHHVELIPGRWSWHRLRARVEVTVVPEACDSTVGGLRWLVSLLAGRWEVSGAVTERRHSEMSRHSEMLEVDMSDELGERTKARKAAAPFALNERRRLRLQRGRRQ